VAAGSGQELAELATGSDEMELVLAVLGGELLGGVDDAGVVGAARPLSAAMTMSRQLLLGLGRSSGLGGRSVVARSRTARSSASK